MKAKRLRLTALGSLLALALALPTVSRADYVQAQTPFAQGAPASLFTHGGSAGSLFDRPNAVWGSSLRVDSLSLPGRGRLSITLDDLGFPQQLESLSLLVTDLHSIFKRIDGEGSLLFDIGGPGQLFVAVFARTEDRFTPGLYAVTTHFSAVPLPAAAWLLLSGLGGLATLVRRRRR